MAFVATAGGYRDTPSDTPTFVDASAPKQHHHYTIPPASSIPNPPNPQYYPQVMSDIKPRLTKEQHDILETEFQKQQKPSTAVKKGFAEALNVSLDKVNNWFQNRRAKSKQDAKKAAGAFNLYQQHQSQNAPTLNFAGSDSDTSPSFMPPDYYPMMQEDQLSNGMALTAPGSHFHDQNNIHSLPYHSNGQSGDHLNSSLLPLQASHDLFDSPQENRRTLTQARYDAINSNGQLDALHEFSGNADLLNTVFPDMNAGEFKQQHAFAFPAPMGAPLSSSDSSIPSTISEQSIFPSTTAMQDHAALSTTSSDWGDSRSSSVSAPQPQEQSFQTMPVSHQQPTTTSSSQWQPGQSVPVDPSDLQRQFTEAQQRAQQQQQQQQAHQQQFQHEQPLAWPADEAYIRRDSQSGTMLAEQMSGFAIQTPQPQQNSTFKIPAPPQANGGGIAARRQKPRPATLGMAAMRSQSYSGAVQPGSPNQPQISQNLAPGQPLRRIRSSNVINGGVAQGRVMKSMPGSAQRSPMSWTFQDAMNSPNVNTTTRHSSTSSSGNLAPPTPMSPSELPRQEHSRPQFPPWQSSTGHFGRQASISETDAEHNATGSGQSQPVSSPPHTPMYHSQQQAIAQGRIGSTVITENTPPQSAPAVQTTFPANAFMPVAAQIAQPQPQSTHVVQQPQQAFIQAPVQHFTNEQQFQMGGPYGMSAPEMQANLPMQFAASGVPIVNAQGNLTLAYPPQMQHMQFMQHPSTHQQQMAQAAQYNFMSSSGASPPMHVTSQMPKQPSQPATEFFVHEYSPPSDMKRAATPRKAPGDSVPKQFTFANQGPEHFEKDKSKKEAKSGTASSSPASAASS